MSDEKVEETNVMHDYIREQVKEVGHLIAVSDIKTAYENLRQLIGKYLFLTTEIEYSADLLGKLNEKKARLAKRGKGLSGKDSETYHLEAIELGYLLEQNQSLAVHLAVADFVLHREVELQELREYYDVELEKWGIPKLPVPLSQEYSNKRMVLITEAEWGSDVIYDIIETTKFPLLTPQGTLFTISPDLKAAVEESIYQEEKMQELDQNLEDFPMHM